MTGPPDGSGGTPAETFARWHDRWLAPGAIREADSRGRTHPEPEHPYRTCFQRDRDRVLHCTAFRRLDYKTQAFVPHEIDHFRTRLTHTLEVAQTARTLGRALQLNEDLIEAVALAHDLGHPPFGHAGEGALAEKMAEGGGFEHNRQSLRIVEYLEHPYPAFRGLNLTGAVRECMARHESRSPAPVSEEFPPGLEAPLEGQLADLADEIAYTAADVEDALFSGRIDAEDLQGLELWRRARERAEASWPDARSIHIRIRATKNLLALLADDLVTGSLQALAEAAVDSPEAVRRAGGKLIRLTPETAADFHALQRFMLERVYRHPESVRRDEEGRRILHELFDRFREGPDLLPGRYLARVEDDGLPRVICDYLAGMTDRFCRATHAKLLGGQ